MRSTDTLDRQTSIKRLREFSHYWNAQGLGLGAARDRVAIIIGQHDWRAVFELRVEDAFAGDVEAVRIHVGDVFAATGRGV